MNKLKRSTMNLNKKIVDSKFDITKNFLYFLIVPAIIILVGIILLCTVNFHLGTDFTGASSFKVYVNNEDTFGDTIESYDINNSDDYQAVYDKINDVLKDNKLTIREYRTSTMYLTDYHVYGGQAVEVVYQNTTDDADLIKTQNSDIRNSIISAFGYSDFNQAVSSVDFIPSSSSFDWIVGIIASVIFTYLIISIYMAFRYDFSIFIVGLLQIALDLFLTISLVLICRLTINLSFGIILLATLIMSIFNLYRFYSKTKNNIRSGRFENAKNQVVANATTKEMALQKTVIYLILLFASLIFTILAVEGVREVALGLMLSIITTYFTSLFILPSLWSTCYKKKAVKKSDKAVKKSK